MPVTTYAYGEIFLLSQWLYRKRYCFGLKKPLQTKRLQGIKRDTFPATKLKSLWLFHSVHV